ncbi:unnamed protein product, partial [Clonostachys rosea]
PLRQLYPKDGDTSVEEKVDIIAVHGLNPRNKKDEAHAWDTWRSADGRLWLRDDLPKILPDARIFLYRYNATAVYGSDQGTFSDKADELLEAIRAERDDIQNRPIIFLGHSMGGLLIKQALINAHNNPNGIGFFATPHRGVCRFGLGITDQDNLKLVIRNVKDLYVNAIKIDTLHDANHVVIEGPETGLNSPGSNQPLHLLPFLENRKFTGRESVLKDIRQSFFVEGRTRVALDGLGGIGKTQVALQFAYWVKKNKPEYSIFWVPALSSTSFGQAYDEISNKLQVRKATPDQDVRDSVRLYLTSHESGKWIMIVDNADDKSLIYGTSGRSGRIEYLPVREDGLILLTSRTQEISTSFAGSDKSLIRKAILRDKKLVAELLKELTHTPLAIVQAAAYFNKNRQLSLKRYLSLLKSTNKSEMSIMSIEFSDPARYRGTSSAILSTWLISFDQILETEPRAADLLMFMSWVEPRAIARSMLPGFDKPEEFEGAISTQCGYSFISQREGDQLLDMHRLVHLATQSWIKSQGKMEQTIEKARNQSDSWRPFLPHGLRLLSQRQTCPLVERIGVCRKVGLSLLHEGRHKEALPYIIEAADWAKEHLFEADHLRLKTDFALACAYLIHRRVKEATNIIERVVSIQKQTLTEDDTFRLESEYVLACAYVENHRAKEATDLLEHVVSIKKQTLAEDHYDRLVSEDLLACAYFSNRRPREAIDILKKIKKMPAEGGANRLASENMLAQAYFADGYVKEAINIPEKVVSTSKQTMAEDDYRRTIVEHNLANAYLADGRVKEATDILEKVVSIRKQTLAEDDPERLASERLLSRAYLAGSRPREASGCVVL